MNDYELISSSLGAHPHQPNVEVYTAKKGLVANSTDRINKNFSKSGDPNIDPQIP